MKLLKQVCAGKQPPPPAYGSDGSSNRQMHQALPVGPNCALHVQIVMAPQQMTLGSLPPLTRTLPTACIPPRTSSARLRSSTPRYGLQQVRRPQLG